MAPSDHSRAASIQNSFDFTGLNDLSMEDIEADEALLLDLDGYEGPLHILLELAKRQKVDLLKISILRLADQYLNFVHLTRRRQFSLAADYLVMASWLAFLKSRLLLPKPEKLKPQELPAEDLALSLAYRLKKLDILGTAIDNLQKRPQLGRDVFARGSESEKILIETPKLDVKLYDLLKAYADRKSEIMPQTYSLKHRDIVYSLEHARSFLQKHIYQRTNWVEFDQLMSESEQKKNFSHTTLRASSFGALLDLCKQKLCDVKQDETFGQISIRATAFPVIEQGAGGMT